MQVTTLVEFFSPNTLENVLGAFAFTPQNLIFIMDPRQEERDVEDTLCALQRRLPGLQVRRYVAETWQLEPIQNALKQAFHDYPDSIFDFTGGSELMLLAAYGFGFQHDAPMLHIDMERQELVNINRCEELIRAFDFPQLTLEDHLNLNGAFLAGWGRNLPEEKWNDRIRAFCNLVLEDQHKWKEQCHYLQMAAARAKDLQVDSCLTFRTADGVPVPGDGAYLKRLEQVGMLEQVQLRDNRVRFRFPDPAIRRFLCDSGKWLELHTYLLLQESGRFTDIRMSVRMGWGQAEEQAAGTAYNEIDIIACTGITALFISCKSGLPNPNSMNEILVYARKFGGVRAKAAMVTSAEISHGFVGLRKRASDLGTVIVDESDIKEGLAQGMLLEILDQKR